EHVFGFLKEAPSLRETRFHASSWVKGRRETMTHFSPFVNGARAVIYSLPSHILSLYDHSEKKYQTRFEPLRQRLAWLALAHGRLAGRRGARPLRLDHDALGFS